VKYIILLISLLSGLFLKAQDDFFNPYFLFEKSEKVYVLNNWVKVYEKPDSKSLILDKLPIATIVNIKSRTDSITTINGIRAPWYLISYDKKQYLKEAYIWGGSLSLSTENINNDSGVLFLYGISKVEKLKRYDENIEQLRISCRAVDNNRQIGKKEFKGFGSIEFYRNLVVNPGLGVKAVKNILNFEYRNNYYVGEYGAQIVFWNGKKFIFVKNLENLGDPPCYSIETFIYPSQKEGMKNLILLKSETGCMEEGKDGIVEKVTAFYWKNNKLIPK
jgi:hypothetical protein